MITQQEFLRVTMAERVMKSEDFEIGNQLRQVSPMACQLPNDVRLMIIAQVRQFKDGCGVKQQKLEPI